MKKETSKILTTEIEGILIIEPIVYLDTRGYFFESFNRLLLENANIVFNPVQENQSMSLKGVMRGLHYQLNPYAQAKIVRVIVGKAIDFILDIRKKSSTYGKWISIDLNSESARQVFIPHGFAHGFLVLSDYAIFHYICNDYYNQENQRGININDTELAIPRDNNLTPILSEKDMNFPYFKDAENNF